MSAEAPATRLRLIDLNKHTWFKPRPLQLGPTSRSAMFPELRSDWLRQI